MPRTLFQIIAAASLSAAALPTTNAVLLEVLEPGKAIHIRTYQPFREGYSHYDSQSQGGAALSRRSAVACITHHNPARLGFLLLPLTPEEALLLGDTPTAWQLPALRMLAKHHLVRLATAQPKLAQVDMEFA